MVHREATAGPARLPADGALLVLPGEQYRIPWFRYAATLDKLAEPVRGQYRRRTVTRRLAQRGRSW